MLIWGKRRGQKMFLSSVVLIEKRLLVKLKKKVCTSRSCFFCWLGSQGCTSHPLGRGNMTIWSSGCATVRHCMHINKLSSRGCFSGVALAVGPRGVCVARNGRDVVSRLDFKHLLGRLLSFVRFISFCISCGLWKILDKAKVAMMSLSPKGTRSLFKNRIMWSCGGESFHSQDILACQNHSKTFGVSHVRKIYKLQGLNGWSKHQVSVGHN